MKEKKRFVRANYDPNYEKNRWDAMKQWIEGNNNNFETESKCEINFQEIKATEHDLEEYLKYGCKLVGWKCEKLDPKQLGKGVPDRKIITSSDKTIYVELKTPKENGHLSFDQIAYHEKLRNYGEEVRVIWSKDQVDKLLNE